ncbi:MAG: 5-carboxymethyl-2-hydroxymuconate isomerase [Pseudomonadota bacterium]
MPHQIIEYSTNLEAQLPIDALVATLHAHARTIDALPLAGLRTRAYAARSALIADEHPENGFVAVYLRIGKGRDEATRVAIGESLSGALFEFCAPLLERLPLALSYEVQEIEPATRWNHGNLRSYLARRQQGTS